MPNELLHGDCLELLKNVADSSIDLIVTDPPYGINYRSNRQRVDRIKSVNENQSVVVRPHYFSPIENDHCSVHWLAEAYRVLREGGAMYVFAHWTRWGELAQSAEDAGFSLKNMIVLNKSNHGMGDLKGQYAPKHELMLFATKGRHVCRWPEGRMNDVWNVPVVFSGAHKSHPNEKPLSWLTPAITNSSDPGQTVLDPFMGSGSTGIAAVYASRQFVGIEMDRTYYETAQTRVEQAVKDVEAKAKVF